MGASLVGVIATLVLAGPGAAEVARVEPTWDWDLRMGPGFTWVTGPLGRSLSHSASGFEGGVGFRWSNGARVGVEGDLLLTLRRRSFDDSVGYRRSLRAGYFQGAVLARGRIHQAGRLRLYALAGPYLARRRFAEIRPGVYVGDEPVNPNDVRPLDAGFVLGFGSDLISGPGRVSFETRLEQGLVDVLEKGAGQEGGYRVLSIVIAFTPSR